MTGIASHPDSALPEIKMQVFLETWRIVTDL
jgi:hypothetical protein